MNTLRPYLLALLVILFCLYSCNSNPDKISNYTPGNEKDTLHVSGGIVKTVRGKEVFTQRCILCHGQSGTLKNDNAANLRVSVLDSISIIRTIRQGRGVMPMFSADAIPDSDIGQLELYVKTLRQ